MTLDVRLLTFPSVTRSAPGRVDSRKAAFEATRNAVDEFIGWYCSKARLVFNRTVVLGDRFFLEQKKNLAASTSNVRVAAVRRLAYEASVTGLLSPELAAGIRRVKGAKRLGGRIYQ